MDWSADHVGYVVAAYVFVAIVLVGIVLRTFMKAKSLKSALQDMNLPDTGQRD